MNPTTLTRDEISLICDEARDVVYKLGSYRKLIGKMIVELKRDIVPISNLNELKHIFCKGLSTNTINPHQACHGASAYAIQYHLKEGYCIETSKQLGCTMWNQMQNCNYFPKWKTKKELIDDDDDINIKKLEKMCRVHHKRCNLNEIKYLTYGSKYKPYTYWKCFDEAIVPLKNYTNNISEYEINEVLRMWNVNKGLELFHFVKN
jgi:hypothetical protein